MFASIAKYAQVCDPSFLLLLWKCRSSVCRLKEAKLLDDTDSPKAPLQTEAERTKKTPPIIRDVLVGVARSPRSLSDFIFATAARSCACTTVHDETLRHCNEYQHTNKLFHALRLHRSGWKRSCFVRCPRACPTMALRASKGLPNSGSQIASIES